MYGSPASYATCTSDSDHYKLQDKASNDWKGGKCLLLSPTNYAKKIKIIILIISSLELGDECFIYLFILCRSLQSPNLHNFQKFT